MSTSTTPAIASGAPIASQAGVYLSVVSGKHADAQIALPVGTSLDIGSAPSADILLLDEGVKPLHAQIGWDGTAINWKACEDGVSAFGARIAKGKQVLLRPGAVVAIAGVEMHVGGLVSNADLTLAADRHFMLHRAPFRLALREWSRLQFGTRIAIVVSLVLAVLLLNTLGRPQDGPTFDDVQALSGYVKKHFPDAWVRLDEVNQTVVYGGYVANKRELDRLRLLVWNTGVDVPSMRVHAMDDVSAATRAYLERFYPELRVVVDAPGRITIEIQRSAPAKSLAAWDFEEVKRQARVAVPGLEGLEIAPVDDITTAPVRVPMAQLNLNLIDAPAGRYLSGAKGERYFAGASIKDGTVTEITRCWARFRPVGRSAVYQLTPERGSNDICR